MWQQDCSTRVCCLARSLLFVILCVVVLTFSQHTSRCRLCDGCVCLVLLQLLQTCLPTSWLCAKWCGGCCCGWPLRLLIPTLLKSQPFLLERRMPLPVARLPCVMLQSQQSHVCTCEETLRCVLRSCSTRPSPAVNPAHTCTAWNLLAHRPLPAC